MYGEYKSFDGVVLPTLLRTSQGEQLMFEARILEVDFPANFAPELFDPLKDKSPGVADPK